MRQPRLVMIAAAVIFTLALSGARADAAQDKESRRAIVTPGRVIAVTEGTLPADSERGGLVIIQFRGEPDEIDLLQMKLRRVELGPPLGHGAYWARVESADALRGLGCVRAAIRPQPSDKVAPLLARRAAAAGREGRVRISLSLFDGTSFEQAAALLAGNGGFALHGGLYYGGRLEAVIPASSLAKVAASDLVMAVEPLLERRAVRNEISAARSRIDIARATFGIDGSGVALGIWDGGKVFIHRDLEGRVTVVEDVNISEHATHVAGIIASSGASRPQGTGMAPASYLYSYDYEGDVVGEMSSARSGYGIAISNNSWGYVLGWELDTEEEDRWEWYGDYFGWYFGISAAYDDLIYDKNLAIVFSAGNDRNDSGPQPGQSWWDFDNYEDGKEVTDPPPPPDGPYSCMDINASAKNVIAVGATGFVDDMTSFSSWGPTLDGRIKPEVVAKGLLTLSTGLQNQYTFLSGTSMAAPVVSGGLALLEEHWRNLTGQSPSPAVLRALITATAKDLGNKGPDYSYGFGLLDIYAAAEVMSDDEDHNTIIEDLVKKRESKRTKYYRFQLGAGTSQLKVGLAWIDPAAAPLAQKTLVNDLDLKLMWVKRGKIKKEYRPWVLNGAKPDAPATTGINDTDNIELVEVNKPKKTGEWVVEVTAAEFGKFSKQKFALVVVADKPLKGAVQETDEP